jgi:hypothetical protein
VALASNGWPQGGQARTEAASPPRLSGVAVEYLLLVEIVGVVGIGSLFAYALGGSFRRRRGDAGDVRSRPVRSWLSWLIGPLLVSGVLGLWLVLLHRTSGPQGHLELSVGSQGSGVTPAGTAGGSRQAQVWSWGPVAVVGGAVVALAVATLLLASRRQRPHAGTGGRQRSQLARVVRRSIEEIRADPDPRHAIIAAYARMETDLADGGVPRRPSSSPMEYVQHVLNHLAVPSAPIHSLTALFEIARFSTAPVDEGMKHRAIAALLEIGRGLGLEETF